MWANVSAGGRRGTLTGRGAVFFNDAGVTTKSSYRDEIDFFNLSLVWRGSGDDLGGDAIIIIPRSLGDDTHYRKRR